MTVMTPPIEREPFVLDIVRPSTEGAGVGRLPDGRAVFVDGALPGERVTAVVVHQSKRFARASTLEVLDAHPGRVRPPCPQSAKGCGGCDLDHAAPDLQAELKRHIVADAVERIGRLERPAVAFAALPGEGHRTTARVGIHGGRAGFHRRRSSDVVSLDGCLVAHPLLEELIVDGRYGAAEEAMLRVGARTGERLALVEPSAADVVLPPDVVVVGPDDPPRWIHEEVAGHRFRISVGSFFQTRPDGAEALVDHVQRAIAGHVGGTPSHLVDLGAGVGLFAPTVPAGRVTAVERNRSSAADLRVNLAHLDAATVVEDAVEQWRPVAADVVVADPSRAGLGAEACRVVAGTGAGLVVLVSCDAAAGARDLGALVAEGYSLRSVTVVDLFPHTHHVEVVSVLTR